MKIGRGAVLKIVKLEILQSALNETKPNSMNRASKVTSICALKYPESHQNFVSFALRSAVVEIFHVLGFPIDSNVKISTRHKFRKTCPIAKKSKSLHSPMVANVLIKFGWDPMKTVGEVLFLKFSAPYGPVLGKKIKVP